MKHTDIYEIVESFVELVPTATNPDFINMSAYSTIDQPTTRQWRCDQEPSEFRGKGQSVFSEHWQATNNDTLITRTSFPLQLYSAIPPPNKA